MHPRPSLTRRRPPGRRLADSAVFQAVQERFQRFLELGVGVMLGEFGLHAGRPAGRG